MADKTEQACSWARLPNETSKAYEAFSIYRDLGPERTLPKAAAACNKSLAMMKKWSTTNKWVERAAAYDNEIDRQAAREMIRDIAKTRAKQRKMATQMQTKGMDLLKEIKEGDAKLSEIVALLKLGMEQERITLGDVGEVIEERDGGQTATPVQFYMPDNGRDKKEEEQS